MLCTQGCKCLCMCVYMKGLPSCPVLDLLSTISFYFLNINHQLLRKSILLFQVNISNSKQDKYAPPNHPHHHMGTLSPHPRKRSILPIRTLHQSVGHSNDLFHLPGQSRDMGSRPRRNTILSSFVPNAKPSIRTTHIPKKKHLTNAYHYW